MNFKNTAQNKILFIEDDPSIQTVVRRYLSKNYDVIALSNCMMAMSFLQNGDLPDIVVTDLNTPELNGFEMLVQLKSSGFFNSIPVIILSGEEGTDTRIKCLEAGADDYIVKPFNPRELQARINVILKRTGTIINTE
jgi:DNA-binding response OmpR family regulator